MSQEVCEQVDDYSIELNEKLYSAIIKQDVDYEYIEDLLKQGADPLGPLMDKYETAISMLFCEASEEWYDDEEDEDFVEYFLCDRLPVLFELFIKKGFDCSRFKSVENDYNSELWCFSFSISEGACKTLKIMIENGLPIPALEDFISHFYTDCAMCGGSELTDYYEEYLVWAFKMIMLCASYPEIAEKSKLLRICIEIDSTNAANTYDLLRFRNYDNYEYRFDLSTGDNIPYGMKNATVEVREKGSEKVIWKMSI